MTTAGRLADWIEARLTERERVARAAADGSPGVWEHHCPHEGIIGPIPWSHDLCTSIDYDGTRTFGEAGHSPAQAAHIALNDPASVLLDVEAKRRILALHTPVHDMACAVCGWGEGSGDLYGTFWPCATVKALAAGMGWIGG